MKIIENQRHNILTFFFFTALTLILILIKQISLCDTAFVMKYLKVKKNTSEDKTETVLKVHPPPRATKYKKGEFYPNMIGKAARSYFFSVQATKALPPPTLELSDHIFWVHYFLSFKKVIFS